jgi:hypothetical protein
VSSTAYPIDLCPTTPFEKGGLRGRGQNGVRLREAQSKLIPDNENNQNQIKPKKLTIDTTYVKLIIPGTFPVGIKMVS